MTETGHESRIVWSAMPTPFHDDGRLDIASLDRLIAHQAALGVSGVLLAGTTGEGPWLPDAQRAALAREATRLAGTRLHVALQVSDTSPARVRANMTQAEAAGVNMVVLAAPTFTRFAGRDFVVRYFAESLAAAPLPVGLYVLASAPGTPPDLDMWLELAEHPAVSAIKDSSGSNAYAAAFASLQQRRKDLVLLTGNEFDVIAASDAGYNGGLLGTAVLNAGMVHRLFEALAQGQREAASAWQTRSNNLLYDIFGRDLSRWLGGLKYALKRLGIIESEYMHLTFPLTPADRRRIDEALEREKEWIRP